NHRVLQYLEFFRLDSRDRFEIWLARLGRYEGMIRDRLRAKRLPEDLVYLSLIESGFSNTAVSRAKAVGMWQFMASTARLYGLTVDPWVDERRDPRDYVPKLIAASLIAKQPRRYGFEDVEPLPPLVFDEITVADATGLDVIARLADTSVAAILELNSQFVRGITPPGRVVVVR